MAVSAYRTKSQLKRARQCGKGVSETALYHQTRVLNLEGAVAPRRAGTSCSDAGQGHFGLTVKACLRPI